MLFNFHQTASKLAIATVGAALPFGLLSSAANAMTVDFAQPENQPPVITDTFSQDGVTVTGSNDLFIGFSEAVDTFFPDDPFVVETTNGIGVVGGDVSGAFFPEVTANPNAFIDSGESVSFIFDSIVRDVSFTLFPTVQIDQTAAFLPGIVEAFGAGGGLLGTAEVTDTLFDVSSAFNDQELSGFNFTVDGNSITSISNVSFEEVQEVPTPSLAIGVVMFGINMVRKRRRSQA